MWERRLCDERVHRLLLARARRVDLGHLVVLPRPSRALDARLPWPVARELPQHLEPRPARGRLPAPRAPSAAQLPQVRPPRAARAHDVGLAGPRPPPRPAHAAARLDVLPA